MIHKAIEMKNFKPCVLAVIFILMLGLQACDKDQPLPAPAPADNSPRDTTYISSIQNPQQKVVLLEEFTGVYCYTCPATHQVVATIIDNYQGRVAAINTHSTHFNNYSDPSIMGNKYDFRTEDGDSIVTLLGGVVSLPSASIDREIQTGETVIISKNRDLWDSYVAQQLISSVSVNVDISSEYISSERRLQLVIELNYVEDVSAINFLSVLLVENNIIDKQLDGNSVIVPDYSHMHIFRDYLTDFKGNQITATKEAGRVYIRVFDYTIPAEWNANNLEVIAFVHENEVSNELLQAAIKSIIN